MIFKNKGSVLRIKTGYNPNSSSIGVNITPLLIAGGLAVLLLPIISFLVIRKLKKKDTDRSEGSPHQ